ncbi:MAG: hypothetical protein KAI47_04470 [Deltaproteobacteria bacterium]|nr:hypothetical protein [Deltaproteobacteria bacterium]
MNDKDACYRWIQGELVRFQYLSLPRQHKGVVLRYLTKVSGYSWQQVTRLVAQYRRRDRVQRRQRTVAGFERKYTAADIRLLAEIDERQLLLSPNDNYFCCSVGSLLPCWLAIRDNRSFVAGSECDFGIDDAVDPDPDAEEETTFDIDILN